MRLVLAVCSTDTLALPGVRRLLRAEPGLTVVPADQLPGADVALVVADELDAGARALLDRVVRASTARVVLVADHAEAPPPHPRVAAVLPRRTASPAALLSAVDTAARRTPRAVRQPASPGPVLTSRERALLRLLAEGYDTAEIATELLYSERTVKNIVHDLLNRLDLRNRPHAVAYAIRTGVL